MIGQFLRIAASTAVAAVLAASPLGGAQAASEPSTSQGAAPQGTAGQSGAPAPLSVPPSDNGGDRDWDVGEEMC